MSAVDAARRAARAVAVYVQRVRAAYAERDAVWAAMDTDTARRRRAGEPFVEDAVFDALQDRAWRSRTELTRAWLARPRHDESPGGPR